MKLETLKDLYVEQLRDLYSAETQLIDALPDMAKKASHSQLKDAFKEHLKETREQKQRLEKVFESLGEKPGGETCQAMKGLIKEAQELMQKKADADVLDAGLIASAQRVEHYEMAGYGTVVAYADKLNRHDERKMLEETLREEQSADAKLNDIALDVVNAEAAEA